MTTSSDRVPAGVPAQPGAGNADANPADLPATDLLAHYASGALSPVDATEAVLERIERTNPAVNAFSQVWADEARAAAAESDRRWRAGAPSGAVDGVPTAIKDIMLTRSRPTLRGSATADADRDWPEDSPAVARLREAGAVFTGKTTTPEIAWKAVTDSPLTGVTRNPLDLALTPGGSSGGASAAVAAGMGPLATGTDGGGSVRIPAAFTGTVALKPTWGRVPHYPASAFGALAHSGPMTRTVADCALMLDVMSGPDPRDWGAMPPPAESFRAALDTVDVRALRIAYSPALHGLYVDPEVAAAVRAAVAELERLGARVEQVDPPLEDCRQAFHVLWFSGAAKAMAGVPGDKRHLIDPGLQEVIEEGLGYTAQDYLDATAVRMALGEAMGRFHEQYDLLVTPAVGIAPFEAGREVPEGWDDPRWTSWAGFSYPFNMTSQPAISVPCGTAHDLPVGLQIVGPRHADARVLAAAHAFEGADRR